MDENLEPVSSRTGPGGASDSDPSPGRTDTLKAFKEEVIEGISLDSAQWSDRLVITTSGRIAEASETRRKKQLTRPTAPTAADPGWFEHAHLDEEMPLRQLVSDSRKR